MQKIYVTNITKDIIPIEEIPLHQLTCDIRYEGSKEIDLKQTIYTLSEQQYADVKEKGYCFINCCNTPD